KDKPYIRDPVFAANFMSDLAKELPPEYGKVSFGEVDFSEFYALVDEEKRRKESVSKEEKKGLATQRKVRKEQLRQKFGLAVVDGKQVEIANWMVEPPGLFMGRGSHPMRGHWKPRVTQKDIVLNLDEDVQPPPGEW